jgi:hypothetical protein
MVQQLTANGFVKQAEDGARAGTYSARAQQIVLYNSVDGKKILKLFSHCFALAAIVEDSEMDTSTPAAAVSFDTIQQCIHTPYLLYVRYMYTSI